MSEKSTWDVVSWSELIHSIPVEYCTEKVLEQVQYWYHNEISTIISYVKGLLAAGKEYSAFMDAFVGGRDSVQLIAHFNVKDLSKVDNPDQINWHFQNTSQWVYAGAIVINKRAVDDGDDHLVSTHH